MLSKLRISMMREVLLRLKSKGLNFNRTALRVVLLILFYQYEIWAPCELCTASDMFPQFICKKCFIVQYNSFW